MVNPGILALIILAILLVIGFVVLIVVAATTHSSSNSGNTGTSASMPCSQNINISSLIQIPQTGANCVQQGITGSLYYVGNLGDKTYDYVVSPWSYQTLDVCIGYCSSYSNGNCTGPSWAGQSAQANFDHCMKQLSSTECIPPIPIAAKGTTIYYAFSPTCRQCDNCV